MRKVQDAGKGLAAFRRDAAAATRTQCDRLHSSDLMIRHWKARDAGVGLAVLRSDAAAGTRAQHDHLHCGEQCIREVQDAG